MCRNRIPKIFQTQRKLQQIKKRVVKFVDNKNKNNKDNNRTHKKKSGNSDNKKDTTTKNDSVAEIQASDLDTGTDIEDSDSMGWTNLPEIPLTLGNSDTCNSDKTK